MTINQQIKFIVINKRADSLYSLIDDVQYHATSVGRNTRKTLISSQAFLQNNCNKEGFNSGCSAYTKARIGIIGNNENACSTCDSSIGFVTGGYADDSVLCGSAAMHRADNGNRLVKVMGYILVQ